MSQLSTWLLLLLHEVWPCPRCLWCGMDTTCASILSLVKLEETLWWEVVGMMVEPNWIHVYPCSLSSRPSIHPSCLDPWSLYSPREVFQQRLILIQSNPNPNRQMVHPFLSPFHSTIQGETTTRATQPPPISFPLPLLEQSLLQHMRRYTTQTNHAQNQSAGIHTKRFHHEPSDVWIPSKEAPKQEKHRTIPSNRRTYQLPTDADQFDFYETRTTS